MKFSFWDVNILEPSWANPGRQCGKLRNRARAQDPTVFEQLAVN
jgi:hypothetical protein